MPNYDTNNAIEKLYLINYIISLEYDYYLNKYYNKYFILILLILFFIILTKLLYQLFL